MHSHLRPSWRRLRVLLVMTAAHLASGAFAGGAIAQTKYPYIDLLHPVVVRRGTATEVTVHASGSLKSAYGALVEGDGIKAEVLPHTEEKKTPDAQAIVRLEVSPEAVPGPRDIRLLTEDAITTTARFLVTDLPAVVEADASASPEGQEITFPAAVSGRIASSVEVDRYRFRAAKGERVSFNLLGARLHETIQHVGRFTPHFDAFISISDAAGVEHGSSDDRFFADPLLSFEAPADGEYRLSVREANYRGHASYTYALIGVKGALPALTFPLAAPPGKPAEVELVGPGLGAGSRGQVLLPEGAEPGRPVLVRPKLPDGSETLETWVVPSVLPAILEAEKADAGENDDPASARAIPLPAGIDGRLGRPDDVDCFAFEAVKGTAYAFEVFARRVFSALDSEVVVLDAAGKAAASGDDARDLAGRGTKDTLLLWTAPAGGRYTLRIRDLHQRGGPDFVYRLECSAAEPGFDLSIDPELAMIGPGNRSPIYVRALRKGGFDGEVAIELEGLPAGITALAPPILPGMTDACIILQAAADAPRGGSLYRVRGSAVIRRTDGTEARVTRRAVPLVEIYQAQRVEGRTAGIAVTSPSDIEVTAGATEVVLRPGEAKEIPIKIVRGPRYKSGPVTLWGMWRYEGAVFGNSLPPGVSVDEGKSRTSLNGESVDGIIALRAAADAKPISKVQIAVIGLVPIEFSVFVAFATPPILVSVVPPAS